MFPSNPKGIIVFDINVSGEITEDTVKVIFIKTTSDATVVSSTVNYNLPAAPTDPTDPTAPTTTAKDPNTSDGSAMGMFAFIALAIASLACAVVVIVRRKRA